MDHELNFDELLKLVFTVEPMVAPGLVARKMVELSPPCAFPLGR